MKRRKKRKNKKNKIANPLDKTKSILYNVIANIRRHGQAVRHRSAKPLSPGSNPGGASKKSCTKVWDFYFLPLTSSLLPKMTEFFGR